MLQIASLAFLLAACWVGRELIARSPKVAVMTTAGIFSAMAFAPAGAATESATAQPRSQAQNYYEALSPNELKTYTSLLTAEGKKVSGSVKTQDITLFRWQRTPDLTLESDHVSFQLNSRGELAGFARMIPSAADGPLPEQEKAEQIARAFLLAYAPDLLPVMNIQWIRPHTDERYTDGQKQYSINGMKVKCRNSADGTYFWVIVGSDNSVIVFERDIEWDFIRAGRQTEKWLHDDWLRKEKISFTKN